MKIIAVFSIILLALTMSLDSAPGNGSKSKYKSKFKSKGEVAIESRLFRNDDIDATEDFNLDIFARLETSYKRGPLRAAFRIFGRADKGDRKRSIIALEEAWVGYRKSGWTIKLGAQLLNWSMTEAFHPADIMNSRLLDSDIEKQEKLGEFMLSVKRKVGRGSITAYLMPRYEAPEFPSPASRLNFLPLGMEAGNAMWIDSDGNVKKDPYGLQWGFRFSQTIGSMEMNLHYIRHQDRHQPVMLPDMTTGTLYPLYLPVRDIGGTFLNVMGAWLFKLEYNYRDFIQPEQPVYTSFAAPIWVEQPDHSQLALGVETGWNYKNGGEGTLILEAQGLFGVNKAERARLHVFQRDILLGYRHAWNDVLSRELLVTFIYDIERKQEYLINVSYKQRLNDTWGVKLGFRLVDAPKKEVLPAGLEPFHKSNQVYMTITKYF